MRLLIYGLNYAPEPTGTGKYTGELAAWLASRGHDVDAIAAPPHYPDWEVDAAYMRDRFRHEEIDGVDVYRAPLSVPSKGEIGAKGRIAMETSFSASSLRHWLPRLFSRETYDAVISVCPPLQIGVLPWLYSRLRGVPWVFHIQDLQVDAAIRLGILSREESWFARLLYRVENGLLSRATKVSTITEAMRQRVIEKGVEGGDAWLVPNWADISFVTPGPQENAFREKLGVPPDETLLLYAGNMGRKQGLDLIVRAADRLRDREDLHFVIVGSGADEARVRQVADELDPPNLRFLPVQPYEDLPGMLRAADIHLVVQKREAADLVMPSKLTNILSAGRPSIATADPGTALFETVERHDAGLNTPPEDLEAFVAAIEELAGDDKRLEQMGANARRYAERFLDQDEILEAFEKKLIDLTDQET